MVSFLAGILLSLLPERYRRWWEPASTLDFLRASFVSGLVQGLGCFVVFILRYLIFFQQRGMEMGGQVIEAGAGGGGGGGGRALHRAAPPRPAATPAGVGPGTAGAAGGGAGAGAARGGHG